MKKLLLLLLFIPFLVNASVNKDLIVNESSALNRAKSYIKGYSDYKKYFDFNQEFVYKFGQTDPFEMGGFLNKDEYNLSLINDSSYLENGKKYWVTGGRCIDNNHLNEYCDLAGVRVTEIAYPQIKVTGNGTYGNPWVFEEGYKVEVRANNSSFGSVSLLTNPSTNSAYVSKGDSVEFIISPRSGYNYNFDKDNCGFVNTGYQKYLISNITKDITCTAVFEAGAYTFSLKSSVGYVIAPSPQVLYYYNRAWYKDSNLTIPINKIMVPYFAGYTFNGYYYNSTKVIDESGNIIVTDLTLSDPTVLNKDLEARVTPNNYNVVYNANGGTGTMGNSIFTYGESGSLRGNTFTYDGYVFAGWDTRSSNQTVRYYNYGYVKNLTTGGTINLYAVWRPKYNPKFTVFSLGTASDGNRKYLTVPGGSTSNQTGGVLSLKDTTDRWNFDANHQSLDGSIIELIYDVRNYSNVMQNSCNVNLLNNEHWCIRSEVKFAGYGSWMDVHYYIRYRNINSGLTGPYSYIRITTKDS